MNLIVPSCYLDVPIHRDTIARDGCIGCGRACAIKDSPSSRSSSLKQETSNMALIDKDFVRSMITAADPWCKSHGAIEDSEHLGAGMLYYSLPYSLRAQTCVCLGSGGGFVPRLMRQAQRDLALAGSRTYLVDGTKQVGPEKKAIWGEPCWTAEDSFFRTNYSEIEIRFELTETAFREYFQPRGIEIDYLHIDADHHYEGAKLDWDLFSTLVPDSGIITLHDTVNYREPCGVYRVLDDIRATGRYDVVNLPIAYGTAIVRKRQSDGRPSS